MPPRTNPFGRTTIKIPTPLYHKLSGLIEGAGYNSVTDFIVYVLRDLAAQYGAKAGKLSQREVESAKTKLENLGSLL